MVDETQSQHLLDPDHPAETDYEVGQDNIQVLGLDMHNPVFLVSGGVIVLFVLLTLIFQETAGTFLNDLRPALTNMFDAGLITAANLFVLFALFLVLSPFGRIRLGGVDAKPEFGYSGWFAMLFAAGMGIGLMFFGVLEPVYHMAVSEPLGVASPIAEDGSIIQENVARAREMGMSGTIFHWGLHPWAIYAVVALALAFFSYNRGLPLTVRSAFHPLIGERVWGWPGHIVDILAVFATLFGLATSLGFGAQQAVAGLEFLGWAPNTITVQVILICCITAVALMSVLAGLDAGVKRLSEINMFFAALLLAFVVIVGPTLAIFTGFFQNIFYYAKDIIPLSNPIGRTDDSFRQGWTAFYWAWWISWSPFVGMFIARVSYGRTVREFIVCVILIPTIVSVFWMTAFGGTAITQVLMDGTGAVKEYVIDSYKPELSLFGMLSELPLAGITSFIAIILVIVFFVTSSDSGSLVIDTITAGGKVDAPVAQRVFWAIFEGLVAIVLLVGGGLSSLQAASVVTGIPFTIVLLLMMYATFKGLVEERRLNKQHGEKPV